jgi:hypothetical protein
MLILSALFISTLTLPAPSLKIERTLLYTSAVTDIVTTRLAIKNGATEGNPILNKIVGKEPSTLKLIGVKLAAIGIIELLAKHHMNKKQYSKAKYFYFIATYMWFLASGLNLSWQFK